MYIFDFFVKSTPYCSFVIYKACVSFAGPFVKFFKFLIFLFFSIFLIPFSGLIPRISTAPAGIFDFLLPHLNNNAYHM